MALVVRRPKWHPPPPQTPRILHLPRRSNRRKNPPHSKNAVVKKPSNSETFFKRAPQMAKLEKLFEQEKKERVFLYDDVVPPVVLLNFNGEERENGDVEERENGIEEREKWRFQAEMLRAECNYLRMEKEIAVKKLEKERGLLEKGLKSAVHTLLSGKKKIREGENVNSVLEEEIEELAKKLMELQRSSKVKHLEHQNCSNFDKQASLLQKQLEKLGEMADESCVKDVGEVSEASSNELSRDGRFEGIASRHKSRRFTDVETLRRKMERLSKGKLLKRMEEEYGSLLSATPNCSVPSSATTSRRFDLPDLSSFSFRQSSQEAQSSEPKACSGHCKAIVRRIMEQVRVETEQWSQMQEMLGQVRGEMEDMQASRDFWEERALGSEYKILTLNSEVDEWKQKALSLENKERQLQNQVGELQLELEKLRIKKTDSEMNVSKDSTCHGKANKDSTPISLGAQLAMEKRVLTCRVKGSNPTSENHDKVSVHHSDGKKTSHRSSSRGVSSSRHPFKDISNSVSPLVRQNSRRYVYPLHCPQDS